MQRELGDDGRFGEYTEVLLNEVNRVNRIIEMLLDLGRPVTLRLAPLNLHQLLERVALLSQEMAAQQGVQIVRRYDPSLPAILVDEDRMLQVFHNLVRNALEAMPAGGRLTLITRLSMSPLFSKVDLGQGPRSLAEVQFVDEGQGIPEVTRAQLFTPFFTTAIGPGRLFSSRILGGARARSRWRASPGDGTRCRGFSGGEVDQRRGGAGPVADEKMAGGFEHRGFRRPATTSR
jgi:nitrogen-specific signal transduction histidine kinase